MQSTGLLHHATVLQNYIKNINKYRQATHKHLVGGKITHVCLFFILNNYVPDTLFNYQGNEIIVKVEQLTGGPGRP